MQVARRIALAAACILLLPAVASGAPNPGGNETKIVSVPPPSGKFFGFNEGMLNGAHGYTPAEHVALAWWAGANVVRTGLDWNFIEPTQDGDTEEHWQPATELYDAAVAAGLKPVFILGFAPEWARDPGGYARDCDWWCPFVQFPPSRSMDGEWAEFVSEAARRFPKAMFEIWNEPNFVGFWESGPDPQRYAELLAIAYDAIKARNRTIKVLGGALSIQEQTDQNGMAMGEFLTQAYDAEPSIRTKMDFLSFHPFPYSATLWSKQNQDTLFARAFASLRAARNAAGDSTRKLFITELGVSTGPPESLTEAQQADTLTRAYRRTMTMGDVRGIVMHRMIEPADWTQDPWELGTGWLRFGPFAPQPRPVYCTFSKMAGRNYGHCPASSSASTRSRGVDPAPRSAGSSNTSLHPRHARPE